MPATIPTRRVDFSSRGTRCAAWLTLPAGPGPHPAVVLVHGLGATHDMMLAQYEQHFAAAGIATLAFDYRFTGASEGEPRQHISTHGQFHDVAAALDHLKSTPEIDGGRIGLWGTSLGGMNVGQGRRSAQRRRGRGGAVPDRARSGCGTKIGTGRGVATDTCHRAGPAAHGHQARSTLRADRRATGRVRDGHRRRR